jgi:hypothetical protein
MTGISIAPSTSSETFLVLQPEAEAKWRNLVDMLPEWLSRVRHPAQFWPQFHALVDEIEAKCGPQERMELRTRIEELVVVLAHRLPEK